MSVARGAASRLGILAIAVGIVFGCTSGPTGSESNTPRVKSTATRLQPGLVDAADVTDIPGIPRLVRVPLRDAPVFENPDPRGPCGALVDSPDMSDGATVVFASEAMTLSDTIIELPEAEARAFLDANIADAIPACAPYESTTNQGITQTVTSRLVELPAVGDQRLGQVAEVQVGGQTGYLGGVLIRRGAFVVVGIVFAALPIREETVQVLAERPDAAAARLA